MCDGNYLQQHITEITRTRSLQGGNVLDLVFTKDDEIIHDIALTCPLGKSDHLVMKIVVNEPITPSSYKLAREIFLFYKGDYRSIRDELETVNWDILFQHRSVDSCWEVFRDKLVELQAKFIPTAKKSERSKPQWMDKSVVRALGDKARAWKRYLMCRTDSNFTSYKKARNRLKSVIIDSRTNFEHLLATEIKENPKAFWKYVGRKTKAPRTQQKIRNSRGKLSDSDSETASYFNSYFASVFTVDSDIDLPVMLVGNSELECSEVKQLKSIQFEEDHILKILQDLKVDKAAGPDGISPRTLWETKFLITRPLRLIFEKSFTEGIIPNDWKQAVVIPIFKKGKKDVPQNYRPISLTCIVCKVMESVIKEALLDHLFSNQLISDQQFGFVPGRSCTLQLLACIEEWSKKLDEGHLVDIIYTDFCKAFDKVSHSKLIDKLEIMGISGQSLNWIKGFLSDRQQKVRVGNSLSYNEPVKSGVPQGSVLGPVLLLAFINDLPDALSPGSCKLFADDTKFFSEILSEEDALSLQDDLNSMTRWSEISSLKLNPGKCKVLHLTEASQTEGYGYYIQEDDGIRLLENVESEKDLGVCMDSKLNFRTHISKIVTTANKVTGIVRRNFKYMGEETFITLYKSLIRPHLEYSSPVWSPSNIGDQKFIENVQRRATKLIPSISELPYPQRLKRLGLPSLQYRRLRADVIQVYKIIHGIDRIEISMFFKLANDERTRGHRYKIVKQRCRTNKRKNFFSNRIVDTWNSLPPEIVESPNINTFKSRLNEFWKSLPVKFNPSFYKY